jgi:hypothetical protein
MFHVGGARTSVHLSLHPEIQLHHERIRELDAGSAGLSLRLDQA